MVLLLLSTFFRSGFVQLVASRTTGHPWLVVISVTTGTPCLITNSAILCPLLGTVQTKEKEMYGLYWGWERCFCVKDHTLKILHTLKVCSWETCYKWLFKDHSSILMHRYHWLCVGINSEPSENQDWFCTRCMAKKQVRRGLNPLGKHCFQMGPF